MKQRRRDLDKELEFIRAGRTAECGEIALSQNLPAERILELAYKTDLRHFVQKGSELARELRVARVMTQTPNTFLNFPVSSVLSPRKAGIEVEKVLTLSEWMLTRYRDKSDILDAIFDLFEQARLNSSLRDDVRMVADEFLCNVLFNATQRDGLNDRALEESVRDSESLKDPAVLRAGAFEGNFVLACVDPYGTLNPKYFLERMYRCVQVGASGAMNLADRGTAGIGGFMIFNACTSLYMSVKKGERSAVCALFPLKSGAKARSLQPKNIHWTHL